MIPVRMLNEYVYCPRLFYLMHVEGLFQDNPDTVRGKMMHDRAEKTQNRIRRKKDQDRGSQDAKNQPLFNKELSLASETLNITGKLDAVEEDAGHCAPVESKHSAGPDGNKEFTCGRWTINGDAWPNDQIQVCAQGLLLRDSGINSEYGYIYYRGSKQKVKIFFTQDLMQLTLDMIAKCIQCSAQPLAPTPLLESNKCIRCSLNAFCLPDETNALTGRIIEPRRIIPGRDDAGVLYIVTQGVTVGKSGDALVLSMHGEKIDEVPMKDVAHVVLMGHIQMTTEALHLLMSSQRTVSYMTSGGRLLGIAQPPLAKNVTLRIAQYRCFDDPGKCLQLSQSVVGSKIENQRTFLRRNGQVAQSTLEHLSELCQNCVSTENIAALRGHEGKAAAMYFEAFASVFRPKDGVRLPQGMLELGHSVNAGFFSFNGRNKRPPRDPVNAMLSFGYSLLSRDFLSALAGVGLDPYFGFYHVTELGRPALALDLMEPFRVLIVDSVVCRMINTGEIKPKDFHCAQTEVILNKQGKALFLEAYERRMDELITHPVFGYKISYRRVIDVECRLLGRYLTGELDEYKPLRTR